MSVEKEFVRVSGVPVQRVSELLEKDGYDYPYPPFIVEWEDLKKYPKGCIHESKMFHVNGVPSTPELIGVLSKVLYTLYGKGRGIVSDIRRRPECYGGRLNVSATFKNGNYCKTAGFPLPTKEQVLKAGIKDNSYNTHNYGRVGSFKGKVVTTMPDGRRFLSIGTRQSGDAWSIYSHGDIYHFPIVRQAKLELTDDEPFIDGRKEVTVKRDQFGNRWGFVDGLKRPNYFLPFWKKNWVRKEKVKGQVYVYSQYSFAYNSPWIGDKNFFVPIRKSELTEQELLLAKYIQEDAGPRVEVIG